MEDYKRVQMYSEWITKHTEWLFITTHLNIYFLFRLLYTIG